MDAKPWYLSVGVWGGVLTLLTGLGLAGINFDPATGNFDGNIYTLGASVGNIITGLMAIWGRVRAKVAVGK